MSDLRFFVWGLLTMSAVLALSGALITVRQTPCPTEDSTNCFWDAQSRGNGQGRSYMDLFGYQLPVLDR